MILLEMLLISLMKSLKMACVHLAALQFRQNSAASSLGCGSGSRLVEPEVSDGGGGETVEGAGDTAGELVEGAGGGETRRGTA